uniref:Uncharacterized protein n=1 Tax=Candidatus Kentrum sp. LPFa TaxID=2126335 RepID=A0A450W7S8_9GAMM|nr:MAG: hypothetical protein BECKLPF1236B_GA0070989_104312 [Candidatus Kentron sp. LPFa]
MKYHFFRFSDFLIILFRIFRESDYLPFGFGAKRWHVTVVGFGIDSLVGAIDSDSGNGFQPERTAFPVGIADMRGGIGEPVFSRIFSLIIARSSPNASSFFANSPSGRV